MWHEVSAGAARASNTEWWKAQHFLTSSALTHLCETTERRMFHPALDLATPACSIVVCTRESAFWKVCTKSLEGQAEDFQPWALTDPYKGGWGGDKNRALECRFQAVAPLTHSDTSFWLSRYLTSKTTKGQIKTCSRQVNSVATVETLVRGTEKVVQPFHHDRLGMKLALLSRELLHLLLSYDWFFPPKYLMTPPCLVLAFPY